MHEAIRKPDAPPTGSVSSSNRADPPSDESFASVNPKQQQQQQQQQNQLVEMQRQQQPIKAGDDSKNAIYIILQASKKVPRPHGTQVSLEEEAQLNDYCRHVLAQNSSIGRPSFLGSATEESGNEDSLQILPVNEHCLSGPFLKTMGSSTSLHCSDEAQVETTAFREPLISSCDERKKNDEGTIEVQPYNPVDEYRDDCYDVLEECDFNCAAMDSDYAAAIDEDHHNMTINRDYPAFDVEEGHHSMMMGDLGEEQPGNYPYISPLSSHQDINNKPSSYLQLTPVESIFSSLTSEASMIQPSTQPPSRFRPGQEHGLNLKELRKRKSDTSEAAMHIVAEIPIPVESAKEAEVDDPFVAMDGDDASVSSKSNDTRVEIHMDECEIDVEWKKGSIKLGGSEISSSTSSSLESEDGEDTTTGPSGIKTSGTIPNTATNNKGYPSAAQDKPTCTTLHQLSASGELRDELGQEEEERRASATYLPFFVAPKLFMPSDSGTDESRSFSSSLSSRSNSRNITPRSYDTTTAYGFEHLLPYQTESMDSSHEAMCQDITSASASKAMQNRKIPIQRGRSSTCRGSRSTGSCDNSVNDPDGDLSKSMSFPCVDASEPEGDLQISSSYRFDECSPRSGSRPRPNTQNQLSGDNILPVENPGRRELGVASPMTIVESESGEEAYTTGGSSTSSGLPKSTSHSAVMSSTQSQSQSPYYSSFSAFQSSKSNQSQDCYRDDVLDDSSESPSQILSEVLRNESNDEVSQSSFSGHSCGCREGEARLNNNIMLDELVMGTFSTERMTDTGESACTSLAGSNNNPSPSAVTLQEEKSFRRSAMQESRETGKEIRGISGLTNQRVPVTDHKILINSKPSPKQVSKSLLQNRASRNVSCSSEEWANSESSESSLILDDSSSYSSHESNLMISEPHEELSTNKGLPETAEPPAADTSALAQPYSIASLQVASLDTKLALQEPLPTLAQPYSIASFQVASLDTKLEKQEYPLVSSLIRKVGSYDAQIIADKTRRQLLRTALSQERLASESTSDFGSTSFLNRDLNADGGDDESATGGRPLQVSPAERSLITMFSSSSSSSCSSSTSKAESTSAEAYHMAGEHASSSPVDDCSESEISSCIASTTPEEPTTAYSYSSPCSSSTSKAESTSAEAYHMAGEHASSSPVDDCSESEISIASTTPEEPTTDTFSGMTDVSKGETPTSGPFEGAVMDDSESEISTASIQPSASTDDAHPGMVGVVSEREEPGQAPFSDPIVLESEWTEDGVTASVLKEDPSINSAETSHNKSANESNQREQHLSRAQIIDSSEEEQVEVHITISETDMELAPSSSSGRESEKSRSPVSEMSKVGGHDEKHQDEDDDEEDRDANDDSDAYCDEDQLSLQISSQDSNAEPPPRLALSSVSNDSQHSELLDFDLATIQSAPNQDAISAGAQNGEEVAQEEEEEEDAMHSSQQLPLLQQVLTRLKRLVQRKPRSEPTLLEPLLPRTIQNLDETALWQIRYNLEPPVDTQFHDDLLYIIEEGHLTSRSTYMLEQRQTMSLCTRVFKKICNLGGFWYFFGLAFVVSALLACGMVGMGI